MRKAAKAWCLSTAKRRSTRNWAFSLAIQGAKLLKLSLLLSILSVIPALAGTVTGTVRNGTTGRPAAGVDLILIELQGTMKPVASTRTDANGQYRFDNPGLGAGPMLIRAVYRGVNYHEPATPDKTTVDVTVYEPTDKPSAFAVTVHAIIVQPNGSDLIVTEEYNISNTTQPPMAYYRPEGSFFFSLPQGAQITNVSAGGSSGMPVVQTPIDKGVDKGVDQQAIAYPFRPGDSQVSLSYRLPYPGNQTALHFASRYAVDHLGVFAPPSVEISADGFTPAGEAQGFSAYTRNSVAANTPVIVSVSGTAPPPSQEAGGEDTQNPSVNSRIETDGGAPVASVTTLPARLDDLKWIIVAGFAALFVLGLIFLARQPQTAVAAAGTAAAAPPGFPAPAHVRVEPTNAPAPAPAASRSSISANLDGQVRGGLDELKDMLFKLELRREAGTINEADYAAARDRIQKSLRDLVKG